MLLILGIATALYGGPVVVQDGLAPSVIFERASPSVAQIVVETLDGKIGQGSGFIIEHGRLVTCWHVVSDATRIVASFPDGSRSTAEIIDAQPDRDCAVLSVKSDLAALPVRKDRPKPGERLYAVGSPEGLTGSILDGLMSQARDVEGTVYYQISIPVTHGNSGGPVLDSSGRVVGMVSWGMSGTQSLNFAVPLSTILTYKRENAAISIEEFREKRLSDWYTLIDRPIVGDELILGGTATVDANGVRHVYRGRSREKVVRKEGDRVLTEVTHLEYEYERNGQKVDSDESKKLGVPGAEWRDLFGQPYGLLTAITTLSADEQVIFRSVYDFLPNSVGSIIKVGQRWEVVLPKRGDVPEAKYTATFVGFEQLNGVRCAKIESVFEDARYGVPHKSRVTRWLWRGSTELRRVEVETEGEIVSTSTTDVSYWKFGPEALRKRPL
jgi:hypothetical protein